eukprot:365323-Chlamydomonas_euryale.AAC.8
MAVEWSRRSMQHPERCDGLHLCACGIHTAIQSQQLCRLSGLRGRDRGRDKDARSHDRNVTGCGASQPECGASAPPSLFDAATLAAAGRPPIVWAMFWKSYGFATRATTKRRAIYGAVPREVPIVDECLRRPGVASVQG